MFSESVETSHGHGTSLILDAWVSPLAVRVFFPYLTVLDVQRRVFKSVETDFSLHVHFGFVYVFEEDELPGVKDLEFLREILDKCLLV